MLTIDQLAKTFPGGKDCEPVLAANDINLQVEEGQLFTLLGPSGCGKTTTLRSVPGLEDPDQGRITVAGRVFFDSETRVSLPVHRRGLGMVFQSYAIWPHLSVFENVAFPLKVLKRNRRLKKAEVAERVARVLSAVHMEYL